MITQFFAGTLVLHARRRVSDFEIPEFRDCYKQRGQHVPGQYNGYWTLHTSISDSASIYLPQRYKHMQTLCTDTEMIWHIQKGLESLDSLYEGSRQLYKLQKLIESLDSKSYGAVVNIEATTANGQATPGSFYILSNRLPVYVALVFDQEEESVRLVWATFDIVAKLRTSSINPNRFVFFRFPVAVSRPLFLPSQVLCQRWYNFTKTFKDKPLGLLTACNAFENFLFKDPKIAY